MKRERFVDMEAFSWYIILHIDGFVTKAAKPASPFASMSTEARVLKAPDRLIENKTGKMCCQFPQTKTALRRSDKRGLGPNKARLKQRPVRKTNPALRGHS